MGSFRSCSDIAPLSSNSDSGLVRTPGLDLAWKRMGQTQQVLVVSTGMLGKRCTQITDDRSLIALISEENLRV